MDKPEFVYTTYIQTTPERLWQALTDPAFTRRYWGLPSSRTGSRDRRYLVLPAG